MLFISYVENGEDSVSTEYYASKAATHVRFANSVEKEIHGNK